jgi:hypothetical protein
MEINRLHDRERSRVKNFQMLSRLLAFLIVVPVVPLSAAEVVVFTSGARLRADRHERAGDIVRLFQGSGVSEVPAHVIADFEPIEAAPPEPELPVQTAVQPVTHGLSPGSPEPPLPNDPLQLIRAAAIREGLPPGFVASVAKVESALRANAISPKGAIGIMQLMPATAQALGADPHDMLQNIDAGTHLLRDLLVKYDGDVVKALSAYNAGTGAVDRYRGLPPFDETRRYVNKVIGAYQRATPHD